jgi:hypothetical protein
MARLAARALVGGLFVLCACSGGDPGTAGGSSETGEPATAGTTTPTPTSGEPGTSTDTPTGTAEVTSMSEGPGTSASSGDPTSETTSEATGGSDGGLTGRAADPVVLIGGQVPGLGDVAAGEIVGFAWRDGWQQVPIQVDERVLVDFCQIYAAALLGDGAPCNTSQVIEALFYADPDTYTGADTDPLFDRDDELVFMARDAGGRVDPGDEPAGVVAGSGVEVELTDGDEVGWVYLYARDPNGGLLPGAGADLISYDLVFAPEIDYKTEYPFVGDGSCGDAVCDPPILEDSRVTTPHYERHFSARWVTDGLKMTTDGASGQDILDIAQARFAPGICGRHVLTFSTAEGAFIANIDGPVRAIRSYMGANSGPLTERTHLFYDRVEVIQTFLRVHPVPAIMELIDYASDAAGMTYYNEHNQGGLAIDGVPDPGFDDTTFTWELISGPHGSVVSTIRPKLSQNLATQAYWEDQADMPTAQCSASNVLDHPDDSAFGTSGLWIVSAIPDTDPRNGADDHVFIERTSYYEAAGLTLPEAMDLVTRAENPPQVVARNPADQLACGDGTCEDAESATCPQDCTPIDQTCGDGVCDLWEDSVSCDADCSTGVMMGPGCGDATCDVGEHELNCADDCWTAMYGPLVDCLGQSCSVQTGACSDEVPCVDTVVCVAECVGGGGMPATCTNMCKLQIVTTTEQEMFVDALLLCAQQQCV